MSDPAIPRQAATVIVARGGAETLEVLLVRRNPAQRFMGGAWVFPGGAVDPGDVSVADDEAHAHRVAAVREVREESGVTLAGPEALIPWSRWITPEPIPIRFDTHFFLAGAPDDASPAVDGAECVDWGWFTPDAALDGERTIMYPTARTLEGLRNFDAAEALLAFAADRAVVPVPDAILGPGEVARVLLPGDPGFV